MRKPKPMSKPSGPIQAAVDDYILSPSPEAFALVEARLRQNYGGLEANYCGLAQEWIDRRRSTAEAKAKSEH